MNSPFAHAPDWSRWWSDAQPDDRRHVLGTVQQPVGYYLIPWLNLPADTRRALEGRPVPQPFNPMTDLPPDLRLTYMTDQLPGRAFFLAHTPRVVILVSLVLLLAAGALLLVAK